MSDPRAGGPIGRRQTGVGLMLVAIIAIQLGSALATTIFDEIGPSGTVLLRTAFGALILALVFRPARLRLDRDGWRDVVLFGLTLAGMNLFFFLAIDRLPLGLAVTFEFAGPLGVALAGSRRPSDLLWVGFAAAAIGLLAPSIGSSLDLLGVAYALTAAAFWAAYILLSARVGRGPAGHGGLSLAMIVASAALLPLAIEPGVELLAPEVLAVGLAVAMLGSAIPFAAELEALRRIPESTFGVLLSIEPAVATLIGFVALDQALAGRELVAIGLVVVACAGALRSAPEVIAEPEA